MTNKKNESTRGTRTRPNKNKAQVSRSEAVSELNKIFKRMERVEI